MSMSKKDYVAIAAALRGALPVAAINHLGPEGLARQAGIEQAARNIAGHCARDNPRFDTVRFLAACGVSK